MKVHYSADTHVGQQRQINQDAYRVQGDSQPDDIGLLMVLCDGMGGHMAGEIASSLGVDTILECYYDSEEADRTAVLREAFEVANTRIYEQGQGTMGTTGVALLLRGDRLDIANVGDSRAYLVRQGQIQQLTQDHSFVWEQVAAGVLTREQARYSHYRNMITRAIGHRPDVEVDLFMAQVYAGDVVVLSSDGLHGLIEDDEIAQMVTSMAPEAAVQSLIDEANQRGGNDNITVIVARLEASDEAASPAPPLGEGEAGEPAPVPPSSSPVSGDAGAPPPGAASAAPTQPDAPQPTSSRRVLVWGALVTMLLLLIGGGTAYMLGFGGNAAVPALVPATETPTPPPVTPSPMPSASPVPPTSTRTPRPTRTPSPAATATSTPTVPAATQTATSTVRPLSTSVPPSPTAIP